MQTLVGVILVLGVIVLTVSFFIALDERDPDASSVRFLIATGAGVLAAGLVTGTIYVESKEDAQEREWRELRFVMSTARSLDGADFAERDAHEAILAGRTIKDPNFRGADLRQATFFGSRLENTRFENAELEGVNMRTSVLRDSSFWDATLAGADLEGSHIVNSDFDRGILLGASLKGATIVNSDFDDADLRDATLGGMRMTLRPLSSEECAVFDILADSTEERAECGVLQGSSMKGARLEGADLRGADIQGVAFDGTRFDERTRLGGARVCGTDFSEALGLTPATVLDAIYDAETIWPEGFVPRKAGAIVARQPYPRCKVRPKG